MFISPERVRIVILTRYPVVCAGLRRLLEDRSGFDVLGDSASVADLVALLGRAHADIVLVDPDSDEIPLQAVSTASEASGGRVLVLTGSRDPTIYTAAIELGACGVVAKEQPAHLLVRAIEKVHAGEVWLDRDKTATVLSRAVRRLRDPETLKIESLTNREREIVGLVGEGLKNARIAERLFISEATVRNHITSILSKLTLANRFELAVYAFRHQLVPPPSEPCATEVRAETGVRRPVTAACASTRTNHRRGGTKSAGVIAMRGNGECTNATSD